MAAAAASGINHPQPTCCRRSRANSTCPTTSSRKPNRRPTFSGTSPVKTIEMAAWTAKGMSRPAPAMASPQPRRPRRVDETRVRRPHTAMLSATMPAPLSATKRTSTTRDGDPKTSSPASPRRRRGAQQALRRLRCAGHSGTPPKAALHQGAGGLTLDRHLPAVKGQRRVTSPHCLLPLSRALIRRCQYGIA